MNLLLALSLPWFPAGQSWQLSLCFILNCSKHVRKWLTLLSLKVAGIHLLVTPRPGDHYCLNEIIMIVPEQLADCYNTWSFTASSWNPETELTFLLLLLSIEVNIYVLSHSDTSTKSFSPCIISSCFVYGEGHCNCQLCSFCGLSSLSLNATFKNPFYFYTIALRISFKIHYCHYTLAW